jgi:hypothetical protein
MAVVAGNGLFPAIPEGDSSCEESWKESSVIVVLDWPPTTPTLSSAATEFESVWVISRCRGTRTGQWSDLPARWLAAERLRDSATSRDRLSAARRRHRSNSRILLKVARGVRSRDDTSARTSWATSCLWRRPSSRVFCTTQGFRGCWCQATPGFVGSTGCTVWAICPNTGC